MRLCVLEGGLKEGAGIIFQNVFTFYFVFQNVFTFYLVFSIVAYPPFNVNSTVYCLDPAL